jgi:hypothetical protein
MGRTSGAHGVHGSLLVIASDLLARRGFEIAWGLITAVVGAAVGVGLQALVTRSASRSDQADARAGAGPMLIVIDNRRQRPAQPRQGRKSALFSDEEALVLAGAVAIGAVAVFLRWRDTITAAITIASLFLYGSGLGMVGYVAARGLLRRRGALVVPIGALLVVTLGFADARALRDPHFRGGRYSRLLDTFDHGGLSRVVDRFGAQGIIFVLYQVLGVVLFATALLVALVALAAVVGRINEALGSRGRWLWLALARATNRPELMIGFACLQALVSWALCSGLGYDALHRLTTSLTAPR